MENNKNLLQRRFRLLSPVEFQCLPRDEKLLYVEEAFNSGLEIDARDGSLILRAEKPPRDDTANENNAVHFFYQNFERQREGVWLCVRFGAFTLPTGHKIEVAPGTVLTEGTSFIGVGLARLLEDHYQRNREAK